MALPATLTIHHNLEHEFLKCLNIFCDLWNNQSSVSRYNNSSLVKTWVWNVPLFHKVPSSPGKRAEVAAKVMSIVTDGMGFRGMHQSEVWSKSADLKFLHTVLDQSVDILWTNRPIVQLKVSSWQMRVQCLRPSHSLFLRNTHVWLT